MKTSSPKKEDMIVNQNPNIRKHIKTIVEILAEVPESFVALMSYAVNDVKIEAKAKQSKKEKAAEKAKAKHHKEERTAATTTLSDNLVGKRIPIGYAGLMLLKDVGSENMLPELLRNGLLDELTLIDEEKARAIFKAIFTSSLIKEKKKTFGITVEDSVVEDTCNKFLDLAQTMKGTEELKVLGCHLADFVQASQRIEKFKLSKDNPSRFPLLRVRNKKYFEDKILIEEQKQAESVITLTTSLSAIAAKEESNKALLDLLEGVKSMVSGLGSQDVEANRDSIEMIIASDSLSEEDRSTMMKIKGVTELDILMLKLRDKLNLKVEEKFTDVVDHAAGMAKVAVEHAGDLDKITKAYKAYKEMLANERRLPVDKDAEQVKLVKALVDFINKPGVKESFFSVEKLKLVMKQAEADPKLREVVSILKADLNHLSTALVEAIPKVSKMISTLEKKERDLVEEFQVKLDEKGKKDKALEESVLKLAGGDVKKEDLVKEVLKLYGEGTKEEDILKLANGNKELVKKVLTQVKEHPTLAEDLLPLMQGNVGVVHDCLGKNKEELAGIINHGMKSVKKDDMMFKLMAPLGINGEFMVDMLQRVNTKEGLAAVEAGLKEGLSKKDIALKVMVETKSVSFVVGHVTYAASKYLANKVKENMLGAGKWTAREAYNFVAKGSSKSGGIAG
jgi:hypothetical protein